MVVGSRSLWGAIFRVHSVPSLVLISTSAPHFLTVFQILSHSLLSRLLGLHSMHTWTGSQNLTGQRQGWARRKVSRVCFSECASRSSTWVKMTPLHRSILHLLWALADLLFLPSDHSENRLWPLLSPAPSPYHFYLSSAQAPLGVRRQWIIGQAVLWSSANAHWVPAIPRPGTRWPKHLLIQNYSYSWEQGNRWPTLNSS